MSEILQPYQTDPYPHREERYELDGVTISIELRWSERLQSWYGTVRDAEAEVIYARRLLRSSYQLGYRQLDARLPPGPIIPIAQDEAQTDEIGFAELGTRVLMIYQLEAELPDGSLPSDAVQAVVV